MLEGVCRRIERYGIPRFEVSFADLARVHQELARRQREPGFEWATGPKRQRPWASAEIAKAQFYKWREAVRRSDAFANALIRDRDGVTYRASLSLRGAQRRAVMEAIVRTSDGSKVVESTIAHPRRPIEELDLWEIIPTLPEFVAPRVPDVDLYAGALAIQSLLFADPIPLWTGHEYLLDAVAVGKLVEWRGRIDWGDGHVESVSCGDELAHTYREPIERTAITLTIIFPEARSLTALIEVRRFGLTELMHERRREPEKD